MNILVTGATGFIGSRLCSKLARAGHTVSALSRDAASAKRRVPDLSVAFSWDPVASPPPPEALVGVDAVANLIGERVAGYWTRSKKAAIWQSRVDSTRRLVTAIERTSPRPQILVSASAIGYYGHDGGDNELTETSPAGEDFLANLCKAWEESALSARDLGLRVACLRTGLVLGRGEGLLKGLLPAARCGLAGPLGSGRQWWSWVHVDDIVGVYLHALQTPVEGPLNVTAPTPVRQKDFFRALGRALRRPVFPRTPAFILKVFLGEFAGEVLASSRVLPRRTEEFGYRFRFMNVESALHDIVK